MKVVYRGFEVSAKRERALGGWDSVYYYAHRVSDGLMLIDDFTEACDPVPDILNGIKRRVDEAIKTKGASEDIPLEVWRETRVMVGT